MSIRAVVFDLDGTLIDSDRDITRAVNAALLALDRAPLSVAAVRRLIGHGARQLLASALDSEDDALIARARAVFIAHYAAHPTAETVVYPGVRALLSALRAQGVACAIATNKPARVTARIVETLALELVSASADEVPRRKPDPAVLALALARLELRCAPADVVYVGDMGVDVETARAYGARSAAVAWGFSPESARAAGPDAWLETPDTLMEWIAQWDQQSAG